jgi:GR25 family glycosyltransferase involved in LPS biosynthesis
VVSDFDYKKKSPSQLSGLYDADAFAKRYGCVPTPGAIGCAAAHRHCYERLVRESGKCALILEDDAVFDEDIAKLVSAIHAADIEYDVLSLKITRGVFRRRPVGECRYGRLYRATLCQFGTYAYLIHRDCAERFSRLQRPSIRHLADWPLETWQFRCFGLDTNAISFSDRQSLVQTDGGHHRASLRSRLAHKRRVLAWTATRFVRLHINRDVVLSKP